MKRSLLYGQAALLGLTLAPADGLAANSACSPANAYAPQWSPPVNVRKDTATPRAYALAADTQGTWVRAYMSSPSYPWKLWIQRSTDKGRTWTTYDSNPSVADIQPFSGPEILVPGYGNHMSLATDNSGTWMLVWHYTHMYYSQSTDNGVTWSAPALLAHNGDDYGEWGETSGHEYQTSELVYDAELEKWVLACVYADYSVGPLHVGVRMAETPEFLTDDEGATWQNIEPGSGSTVRGGSTIGLAADGHGNVVVIWEAFNSSWHQDLMAKRYSIDNGWSSAEWIGNPGPVANLRHPSLATDGLGNWAVMTYLQAPDERYFICTYKSANADGTGWPAATTYDTVTGDPHNMIVESDYYASVTGCGTAIPAPISPGRLVADGSGRWMATFHNGPGSGAGLEMFESRATSNSSRTWTSWSTPVPASHGGQLNSCRVGNTTVGIPTCATDGQNNWIVDYNQGMCHNSNGPLKTVRWMTTAEAGSSAGLPYTLPPMSHGSVVHLGNEDYPSNTLEIPGFNTHTSDAVPTLPSGSCLWANRWVEVSIPAKHRLKVTLSANGNAAVEIRNNSCGVLASAGAPVYSSYQYLEWVNSVSSPQSVLVHTTHLLASGHPNITLECEALYPNCASAIPVECGEDYAYDPWGYGWGPELPLDANATEVAPCAAGTYPGTFANDDIAAGSWLSLTVASGDSVTVSVMDQWYGTSAVALFTDCATLLSCNYVDSYMPASATYTNTTNAPVTIQALVNWSGWSDYATVSIECDTHPGITCATAETISCGQTVTGNMSGTADHLAVKCTHESGMVDKWYTITPPAGQVLTATFNSSTAWHAVSIHKGSCGSLTQLTSCEDAYPATTPAVASTVTDGSTYYLLLETEGTAATYSLQVTCAAAGGACSEALIASCGFSGTIQASNSTDIIPHASQHISWPPSVRASWLQIGPIQPNAGVSVQVQTSEECGIAFYSGCPSNLASTLVRPVVGIGTHSGTWINTGTQPASVRVLINTNAAEAAPTVTVSCATVLSRNEKAGAQVIPCGYTETGHITTYATPSTVPSANPCGLTGIKDVWYRLDVPMALPYGDPMIQVTFTDDMYYGFVLQDEKENPNHEGFIALYEQDPYEGFVLRDFRCGRTSGTFNMPIPGGQADTYFIRVGSSSPSPNKSLSISCFSKL